MRRRIAAYSRILAMLVVLAVLSFAVMLPTTPAVILTQYQSSDQDSSTWLSNDNYYTNSSGDVVHSPAYSLDGSVPAGATAQCADGTYSFSETTSGTCSSHGGVYQWL